MSLSNHSNSFSSHKLFYKKLLFNILQERQSKEQGFTLIELLVSMAILTIVVAMTGTGLVFTISKNTSSDNEITQQANLRRALDFISDEVKSSNGVTQTYPNWIGTTGFTANINPVGSTPIQTQLFLEIPTPVDCIQAILPSTTLTTVIVPNHGLFKGNAIRFSGNNLSAAGITNNITTYYVASAISTLTDCNGITNTSTNNAFTLVDGSNNPVSFTAPPQNFLVRRLVAYYTATPDDAAQWKSPRVLYRATGNCSASSATTYTSDISNCLVMIDSLTTSPFRVDTATATNPTTLTINGQSPTSEITSVSIQAVPRATIK